MAHWGGPVKLIDTSRATPHILLSSSEAERILEELDHKVNKKDIEKLFKYLEEREIVDIDFDY